MTHNNAEWTWAHEQEEEFERIKDAVSKAPAVRYFNEIDLTEGQGDASKDRLGLILKQLDQPVTFANRALTLAEQKY